MAQEQKKEANMFTDWDGNGSNHDLFDDMMDLNVVNETNRSRKSAGGNKQGGCGGSCLVMLITFPLWVPVALIMNAMGLVK